MTILDIIKNNPVKSMHELSHHHPLIVELRKLDPETTAMELVGLMFTGQAVNYLEVEVTYEYEGITIPLRESVSGNAYKRLLPVLKYPVHVLTDDRTVISAVINQINRVNFKDQPCFFQINPFVNSANPKTRLSARS